MNIVLAVNSFLPNLGGRELVVMHLAKAFQKLGHRIRVIGPSGYHSARRYEFEYPVHRFPAIANLKLWKQSPTLEHKPHWKAILQEKMASIQYYYDLKRYGCDVFHAHNTYPTGYIAGKIISRFNIPLVITPHGQDIHKIPDLGHGLRLNPHLDKRINHVLRQADATTAISESMRASLVDAGAPELKIHDIPNGVDLERFGHDTGDDLYEKLKLSRDAQLIISVGNYHPRKGQEVLIKAMNHIIKIHPRAVLIIVGANTEKLHPVIESERLESRVILTGSISLPDIYMAEKDKVCDENSDLLAQLLQSSSVYVSASTDEGAEGLSLALLEAMANSLPVVATNISGNKDIITQAQNGLLVNPRDPEDLAKGIISVLNDTDKSHKFGQNSLKLAQQYSWEAIAQQYLDLYQSLQ